MQGVVRGVIGGGFESLSNLSGSLYSIVKHTTGHDDLRSERAETVRQGLAQAVKGFGHEVFIGVGGVVQEPWRGARQAGARGFAVGVGKGVLGAVSSPVVGVLRASHSVSQGISSSALNLGSYRKAGADLLDPRLVRVRPARRITHLGNIGRYNLEQAILGSYLARISDGQLGNQQLRYFELLPSVDPQGNIQKNTFKLLLVTGDYLILVDLLTFLELRQPKLVS